MTADRLESGLHARFDGVDYRLESRGRGWVLVSESPAPGFEKLPFDKNRGSLYVRRVQPDERLECFDIDHEGEYRGLPVSVSSSTQGRVMAVTRDPQAQQYGFDPFERDSWVRLIPRDDRDLRFVETRTPVPAPWLR
ncbi:hypothetical protein AKH00_13895 [Microbacterium sp. GCS4]|nr:hypothetical protein AKH00_13895 [Microbacterium sp. GCS4]